MSDDEKNALRTTRSTSDDEKTGLPGLRSWRSVYVFVLSCFVLYVVALTVFGRYFA